MFFGPILSSCLNPQMLQKRSESLWKNDVKERECTTVPGNYKFQFMGTLVFFLAFYWILKNIQKIHKLNIYINIHKPFF